MKERASWPMRDWEVRAILEGRKTQTRRVVKPQPMLIYGLHDDRITVIHTNEDNLNEVDHDCWWHNTEADTSIAELGLHGRGRWANLLAHAIRGIWQEGVRGLVSVERPSGKKGVLNCIVVPRKQEGDKECSQAYLHGVSRNAVKAFNASSPFGWEPRKQLAEQLVLGNPDRKLAGPVGARQWDFRRKPSQRKADKCRAQSSQVGDTERIVQPAPCRTNSWDNPSIRISLSEYVAGRLMWVRETWGLTTEDTVCYRADEPGSLVTRWQPSIHMPRWASRITLEIVSVRVERLNDISRYDACWEGLSEITKDGSTMKYGIPDKDGLPGTDDDGWPWHQWRQDPRDAYAHLWESINGAGSWQQNPWVWVVTFKRVQA